MRQWSDHRSFAQWSMKRFAAFGGKCRDNRRRVLLRTELSVRTIALADTPAVSLVYYASKIAGTKCS